MSSLRYSLILAEGLNLSIQVEQKSDGDSPSLLPAPSTRISFAHIRFVHIRAVHGSCPDPRSELLPVAVRSAASCRT